MHENIPEDAAWWENESRTRVVKELLLRPSAVLAQVEVACDMAQAPLGSNQEDFTTLKPKEAAKLLKKKKGS